MRKFLIVEAVVASIATLVIMGYALNNTETEGTAVNAFGLRTPGTNEYGCTSNCTAEYQIDHVYRLFENKPNNYRVDGVRFKVRYTSGARGVRWFKDLGNENEIIISSQIKANLGCLLTAIGREQGYTNFKEGDEVAFFGSLTKVWDPWGIQKVLQIENPTYYKLNGNEDLSLLESPVYIPD